MMEEDVKQGKVARNLLLQFVNDGCVEQEDDGTFTVNDASGKKNFKSNQDDY